jgi:hypothetical protein
MPLRFRASNMNQKKKARRARGLGSDSGLDLAISRFTNSLDCKVTKKIHNKQFFVHFAGTVMYQNLQNPCSRFLLLYTYGGKTFEKKFLPRSFLECFKYCFKPSLSFLFSYFQQGAYLCNYFSKVLFHTENIQF